MTISRRHFLAASGLTLAGGLGPVRRALATSPAPKRPRFLIQFQLAGGVDAILTTDPKLRDQVDARVDLPYGEDEILDLGSHRVGPMFSALRAEVPAMAMINAVEHGSVAHDYGTSNLVHMKQFYPLHNGLGVGLAGRLGAQLSETPLNEAWLLGDGRSIPDFMPARKALVIDDWSSADTTLVAKLRTLSEPANAFASKAIDQELAACSKRGPKDCESLDVVREVIEKMRGTELPPAPKVTIQVPEKTNADIVEHASKTWSVMIRDAAYLLKNNLTRTIFFGVPHGLFDSHAHNLILQRRSCLVFAEGLKALLQTLRETMTSDGVSLYDQTALVFSSELGRNPFLNSAAGKDHFPQHPFILMGPGIRPGQYGQTDKLMGAMPVSVETGKPIKTGKTIQPKLEDVGATIFRWFGLDPAASGYSGRPLEFLLA